MSIVCDRRLHLKIKIKSLAAEARMIRAEERKIGASWKRARARAEAAGQEGPFEPSPASVGRRNDLFLHRWGPVAVHTREALLAYGFLRGRDYARLESSTKCPPDFDDVAKLVERFGPVWGHGEPILDYKARKESEALRWKAWRAAALAHIVGAAEAAK